MKPETEVIIVNFNAGDALCRCVESVFSQQEPIRLTVIDNASSDGSEKELRSRFGHFENVSVLGSDTNQGFARAINFAFRSLRPDGVGPLQETNDSRAYLLILNPDCEMLPGSLNALKSALDEWPEAALAGPVVVDRNGKTLRGTLRRFPDPWRSFMTFTGLWRLGQWFSLFRGVELSSELPDAVTAVEAVSGACMLLRIPAFQEAGCMDEGYGLHCEDLDLMYRLHQQSHQCLLVPAARVFHRQGVSSRSRPMWVHWQKHRGMQRFFVKFQSRSYPFALRWLVIAGIWMRFALTLPLLLFKK